MNKKNNQKTKYMVLSTWGSALLVLSFAIFDKAKTIQIVLLSLSVILTLTGVIGLAKKTDLKNSDESKI